MISARVRRLGTIAAAVLALLLVAVGSASAADLGVGNARFTSPGVRVFDESGVGPGCLVFNLCDDAHVADLTANTTTRIRSTDAGQPVIAECRVNDLVKVKLYGGPPTPAQTFVNSDAAPTITGWASALGVDVNRGADVGLCGALDS